MGLKDTVTRLGSSFDFSILIIEELHQVYAVQGYKRKNLADLLNAFGRLSYLLEIHFPSIHHEQWKLQHAGRLQSHINLPVSIQLRLLPSSAEEEQPPLVATETAVEMGQAYFAEKTAKLVAQFPNDAKAICEFLGRVAGYYKHMKQWQWYICPRSGTTINLHLEPIGTLNPKYFLLAKQACTLARVATINVYPYTVEIVFHAFSQIELLPYNRRHLSRFKPY